MGDPSGKLSQRRKPVGPDQEFLQSPALGNIGDPDNTAGKAGNRLFSRINRDLFQTIRIEQSFSFEGYRGALCNG